MNGPMEIVDTIGFQVNVLLVFLVLETSLYRTKLVSEDIYPAVYSILPVLSTKFPNIYEYLF